MREISAITPGTVGQARRLLRDMERVSWRIPAHLAANVEPITVKQLDFLEHDWLTYFAD